MDDLTAANWNKHTAEQQAAVCAHLAKFGIPWVDATRIRDNGTGYWAVESHTRDAKGSKRLNREKDDFVTETRWIPAGVVPNG